MEQKKHGKIKTLDDIQRERNLSEREETKDKIVGDIRDVMSRLSPKPKKPKIMRRIMWGLALLFILVIIANFILLNIWALKFFIKELFLG